MTHTFNTREHVYACDTCGQIAGVNADERKARAQANRLEGWSWSGGKLTCPYCQESETVAESAGKSK